MSGSENSENIVSLWQVSPGREERGYWPDFRGSNIIAMGWDSLGDLERYSRREDIEKALRRHYPADYPADKYPANDINSIWIFSKLIKEGDVILAKKGASREVYGIGKVTRRYHFVETRETFKHVIDVDWLIGFDEKIEVETTREFVQWTAHSLSQSRFDEVRQSILNRFPDLEGRFNQLMEGPTRAVSQPGNWWIEKTIVRGRPDREAGPYALGKVLWSPQRDRRGADIYKNMREISEGDLVLHLVNNKAIVGVSVVEKECNSDFFVPRGTRWDDGTGKRPGYAVTLKGFKPLRTPIDRNDFLNDEHRQQLLSLIDQGHEVFYNKYLGLREGAYLTRGPDELLEVFNKIYKGRTGEDLPYRSEIGVPAAHLHLVHKIAWHPGGYKGGFCGDAQSTACQAFEYVRKRKMRAPCSPTVFHCVDEDKAFADSGWRMRIHPPRIQKLHELAEGKSLVFLVAPLTKSKTRYRLVGFYTVDKKTIENGNVVELSADRNRSSKFDLEEQKLEYSNTDLKSLFGIQNWTARRSYDFISSENALNVLTKMYETHEDKRISDPDINLAAMKNVMESLRSGARVEVEKEKYAILWSANISLHPDVIEYHQEHIRRVGATYWGVGFPIDTTRFSLPINGYLYTTDSRKVTHIARIEDVEAYGSKQMPKEPRLRPPEYKDEVHRSYFRISKLERLPVPIEVHNFQQWNGERVVRPPQNYVLVMEPRALGPEVSIKDMLRELIEKEPEYSEVIKAAFAHLVAGKNLVVYGPPATSKTYLAKKICEHTCEGGDFCFHTANAEWSYFDIVGGLIPQGDQTIFREGILLEATEKCKKSVEVGMKPCWLIIDELNRANLDLAFGKIFTQLDLDYRDRALETAVKDGRSHDYFMPLSFRILATMNTYDRALLFSLGYAFMRRFAFIPLESLLKEKESMETEAEMQITQDMREVLESETIQRLKEKTKQVVFNHFSKTDGSDKAFIYGEFGIRDKDDVDRVITHFRIQDLDILDVLLYVSSKITNEGLVEIGHAIVFDAAKFIVAYSLLFPEERDIRLILDEVVVSYLLPQLEYFMPKLRKGRIFEEERYRTSWERLTQTIFNLDLPKTSKRLREAEEEFKVIR